MVSKKAIYIVSVFVLCLATLCACGKSKNPVAKAPNTNVSVKYSTTKPEFTAGEIATSRKNNDDDKEYDIEYYDDRGIGVKIEHYRDGKMRYYYTYSALDADGECVQQQYFNSHDKLIGTYDNGFFFDKDGTQITEDMMELMLDKVE